MKALSLAPDWALLVLTGEKTIECRSWQTDYRGPLLICSSNKKIKGTIPGHALVVCELIDISEFERSHLEASCMHAMPQKKSFAWRLDNFRAIEPFRVIGKLRLFDVDDELIEYLDLDMDMTDDEADAAVDRIYGSLFV